jgi:hypothetical protein
MPAHSEKDGYMPVGVNVPAMLPMSMARSILFMVVIHVFANKRQMHPARFIDLFALAYHS